MDQPVQLNAFVWESRPGHMSLTIACALSFRLQHGAEAQIVEPLRFYDDEQAAAFEANMRAPFKPRADLVVYGHACVAANAPEVDAVVVRVRYAEFTKSVRVVGDRVWMRDGTRVVASAPMKFRRLQLAHERSARSAENPRGFDLDAPPAERRAAMPNLERTSQMQSALLGAVPADAPQRANHLRTGPTSHAGAAFVRAVLAGQRPPPPPDGFPFQYFNVAPLDQQLEHIPWGAAIVLENMHAEHALFSSRLPALLPRGFVFDPRTQSHVEVELRCDTLWIDADRSAATIVCRGVVATTYADAAAHASVRIDAFQREERSSAMFETRIGALDRGSGLPFGRQGAESGPQSPTFGPAPTGRAPDDEGGMTTRMDRLTIGQQKVGPPVRQDPTPATPQATSEPPPRGKAFITQEIELAGPVAATPFEAAQDAKDDDPPTRTLAMATQLLPAERPATANRASSHAFEEVESDSSTDSPTQPPRNVQLTPPPPPAPPVEAAPSAPIIRTKKLKPPDIPSTPPPPLPPKPAPREPAKATTATTPVAPKLGLTPPAPRVTPAAPPVKDAPPATTKRPEPPPRVSLPTTEASARLGALKLGNAQLKGAGIMLANAAAAIHGEPKPAVAPLHVPPSKEASALVGEITTEGKIAVPALARPPVVIRDENTDTNAGVAMRPVEARTLEEAEADADRDAFEFPLPKSDGHEVEGVTLEHCAAIRAAMAMPGSDRASVLGKNDLDDATWARIEKAHMARIDQETSKGIMDLLSRYDAAYVAAQDKLRRPIGVKEYARILVAREKGDLAEAMTELGVPRSELMRLDRVWKQRRAAYPDVDNAIGAAVTAQKASAAGR